MKNYQAKTTFLGERKKTILVSIVAVAAFCSYSNVSTPKPYRRLSDDLNQLYATDWGCVSRKHNLIYVHNPKTGGTTIEKSPLFDDVRFYLRKGIRPGTGGHSDIGSMMIDAEERGIAHFTTAAHVRHPCERFISAFRYLTSDKCNSGDKLWRDKNIGDMTIDEFVELAETQNWKPLKETHFMRQYPFVIDKGIFSVDHILCQEQWEEGISRLYESIGLRDTKKYGETKLHNSHETCADLKPSTRQALERFYAVDYCLFGYPSLLDETQGQCVGSIFSKEDFQAKYDECRSTAIQF